MEKKIFISIVALGLAVFAVHKWQAHQNQLKFERDMANEIAVRRMMDRSALDGPSPAELISAPQPTPLVDYADTLPQKPVLFPRNNTAQDRISNQLERDRTRREVESLKREVELDRLNRSFERREDEKKAKRKELEHSLGLDHPK